MPQLWVASPTPFLPLFPAASHLRLLDLSKQVYHKEEEESYGRLITMIKEKSGDLPDAIFTDFAAKIYKRSK